MDCPKVKEGTEKRGAIESVVRVIRKTVSTTFRIAIIRSSTSAQFLSHEPPFPLPPKSRRQAETGWVMIDAGPFAVHVLSKDAREKYFNHQTEW